MIKFTTDIGVEMNLTEEDFKIAITSSIDFAVNEKEYKLEALTADFIAEEITGIIESYHGKPHGMPQEGMNIIKQEIQKHKIQARSSLSESLLAIKESKAKLLEGLTVAEIGSSLDHTVLNEELKDVEYAIESLSIVDGIEREKRLTNTFHSTTSGLLYDALIAYK